MSLLSAVLLAGVIAAAGGRLGWLTPWGVLLASLVGAAVLEGAGMRGGVLMGLFFISGSLLTRWSERDGLHSIDAKGSRRDGVQVAANGTWAAAGAIAIHAAPVIGWSVMAGALGAAQADTWATEIGARAPRAPRLITSGVVVRRGTSGGVTWLGTAGGVAGAALMALATWAVAPPPAALAGLLGGCLGLTVDSILGATVQGTSEPAERIDSLSDGRADGGRPPSVRGVAWCTNDVVNLSGTGVGAATGLALSLLWTMG